MNVRVLVSLKYTNSEGECEDQILSDIVIFSIKKSNLMEMLRNGFKLLSTIAILVQVLSLQ